MRRYCFDPGDPIAINSSLFDLQRAIARSQTIFTNRPCLVILENFIDAVLNVEPENGNDVAMRILKIDDARTIT